MALHEQCVGATDEWYTPPHVFNALGCSFDYDVASPGRDVTPWIPAAVYITADSLSKSWDGFVWMNPPFGGRNGLLPWLDKFFTHRNGIALVPDRTSAPWWQRFAPQTDAILFVSPKLKFIGATGKPGKSPAQGTCLLAAGERAMESLYRAQADRLGVLMQPLKRAADEIGKMRSHLQLAEAGRHVGGLELGVPSGDNSKRLFNVPWELARPVIEAHVAQQRAIIAALSEKARIELGAQP